MSQIQLRETSIHSPLPHNKRTFSPQSCLLLTKEKSSVSEEKNAGEPSISELAVDRKGKGKKKTFKRRVTKQ